MKMKKCLFKTFLFIMMFILFKSNVFADNIKFSVTNNSGTLKPGDSFEIYVNEKGASAEDTIHGYNLNLSINGNVACNQANFTSSDEINSDRDKLHTISCTANGAGQTSISLNGKVTINDEEKDVDVNGTTITVRNLGTDASLKSLKIPNASMTPEFRSDIYEYKANVKDLTSIDITASPNDGNAKVSISDNYKALQKGENKITIQSTSEDGGSTLTYTINVTLTMTPTKEELALIDTTLKSLTISGYKLDFNPSEKKYYLTVPYATTKLSIKAVPTNEKAEVAVVGNSKFTVGKNTVKINVTAADKKTTDTYQIVVTRSEQEKEIIQTCPDETSTTEWIVFSSCMLLTFTLGIILGYFLCKKDVLKHIFKKKEKPEEPVEIETLSDTIDLSDTVKKIKKSKKE